MNALAKRTRADPDEIIALLRNYDNGLGHLRSGSSPTNEGTYQSIVFDVSGRRLFVSDGTSFRIAHRPVSGIRR